MAKRNPTSNQKRRGRDPNSQDQSRSTGEKKAKLSTKRKETATAPGDADSSFPIVGLGASAGGLEAFSDFFTHMPCNSGLAFVVIQHLDPTHKSILVDLLKRYTSMQVLQVEDGMRIEPNCCYVIPPNRDMAVVHRRLHLIAPTAPRGQRLHIDYFFRSMAQDLRDGAICIVLSGTGTDGTQGLKAVKVEAGMTMVQDPVTASYDGMPRSAISTSMVDYVLSTDKMPEQLLAYVRHDFHARPKKATSPKLCDDECRRKVYILLRDHTGHDFSQYKDNTIIRRIERRMTVNQISKPEKYVRYLQQSPVEVDTLFKDLLIGMTSFFRDPEAFEMLRKKAVPCLFDESTRNTPLRIWVPGCSTGEEAYSIAILVQDYMRLHKLNRQIQVFATDIDNEALEMARSGIYPDSIAVDVPTEYLKNYFSREDNTYRVSKGIRDLLMFATQSVIKDPPFSKLDLISCRNLLIYMSSEAQRKLLPLFHYSLNEGGLLFLGPSESIGEFTDDFITLDRKWKLFRRREGFTHELPKLEFVPAPLKNNLPKPAAEAYRPEERGRINLRDFTESTLLADYAPPCVIINGQGDILFVHGRTGKYLEAAQGEANLNLANMAREGLKLKLTAAIRKARAQGKDTRVERVQINLNGESIQFDLILRPVSVENAPEGLIMVVFRDRESQQPVVSDIPHDLSVVSETCIEELEQELHATKGHLHTTIEELETSNEELTSTNEELQSTNEELQSTNEELETSKEELLSVNEELRTVNSELENKVTEVIKVNNDMANLMSSTDIGTLFLDNAMCIQRFTPATTQVVNLIQSDVGRPLSDIATKLVRQDLADQVKEVLNSLNTKEIDVQSRNGHWYMMRIIPYRTIENVIEGAVITFVDITPIKLAEEKFRRLLEAAPDAMIISNSRGNIVMVNKRAERLFGYASKELLGQPVEILVPEVQRRQHTKHRIRYNRAPYARAMAYGMELYARCKNDSTLPVEITLSPLQTAEGVFITSAIRDISKQKAVHQSLRRKNRVLQTCGAGYRKLPQIKGEQQLYENMCRLMVETAGYARAWIGLFFDDKAKKLRTVAQAGFDGVGRDALIKEHTITEQCCNPTDEAVQNGHIAIARPSDPDYISAPGGEFVATAALPLKQGKRVFGVLTFHSTAPDAFDEEECRILNELSEDLSFWVNRVKTQ